MAISLAKPNKALIKAYLKTKTLEAVNNLRIKRALDRENINRAVGVGNFENFEKQYNTEYEQCRNSSKDPIPSKRKLKKVSTNLNLKKLV
ncbi:MULTISPECIES: hypothetical protein [unclassified Microcoleus]|uniref:hypothetical protein n=1 Tax=unclassified Microcoleus TaxID=2642155 RepID=UPI002FD3E75B